MQNRIIAFLFFSILASCAMAQTNGNSPYSRFGIGDLVNENFIHLRSMGSLGSSYVDANHINIVNPASYASLRSTSFDIGVSAKKSYFKSGDDIRKSWSGNLQYLSIAFPLNNPLNEILDQKKKQYNLGMSFTLMPNSTVGYNISSQESIDGIGKIERSYAGNGGSYKFLWGNAIKYREFSFGMNLGYLFGNIEYERKIEFLDLQRAYQDLFNTKYRMRGFIWSTGVLYSKILNLKNLEDKSERVPKMFTAGLRIKSATGFNTNLTETKFGIQNPSNGVQFIDTLSLNENIDGNGKLPVELGFGANYYHGEKYMVGFDFSKTNWSSYTNDADETLEKNPLKNTFSVSFGGFYRPDYKSYNRYFKRVYYRYGLNYQTDPRVIQGEQIKSYALNLGMGLPFIYQRKISHADLGFEIGKKGSGSIIEETYFKLSLGFTFNDDEWFMKRKYN